ncbi:hypothetical protein [Methanoregula formicica]|uniref:Uncharacterized protein n=1 Tax=Methanoregula formicica (strain DSM 22288 / NBRC 105244 / SMSP) TaxID=593750 RepID=L0HGF4_METFS|nr:hypothetical protein [Methanoregula formicica]AGB02403.1 hypothetical protein Metfor_1364 [Methanoregula formicica SMSP]
MDEIASRWCMKHNTISKMIEMHGDMDTSLKPCRLEACEEWKKRGDQCYQMARVSRSKHRV